MSGDIELPRLSACAIVDPSLNVRNFPANSAFAKLNGSWEQPLADEVIDGRSAQANRGFNVFAAQYLRCHVSILYVVIILIYRILQIRRPYWARKVQLGLFKDVEL